MEAKVTCFSIISFITFKHDFLSYHRYLYKTTLSV